METRSACSLSSVSHLLSAQTMFAQRKHLVMFHTVDWEVSDPPPRSPEGSLRPPGVMFGALIGLSAAFSRLPTGRLLSTRKEIISSRIILSYGEGLDGKLPYLRPLPATPPPPWRQQIAVPLALGPVLDRAPRELGYL